MILAFPDGRELGSIIATPMDKSPRRCINWKSIGIYYMIACLWSWPFFWRRDVLHIPETSLPIHWALMWGPGLAALVCMAVFWRSHRRSITLFGDSWSRSIFFYVAPFLILTPVPSSPAERVCPAAFNRCAPDARFHFRGGTGMAWLSARCTSIAPAAQKV